LSLLVADYLTWQIIDQLDQSGISNIDCVYFGQFAIMYTE